MDSAFSMGCLLFARLCARPQPTSLFPSKDALRIMLVNFYLEQEWGGWRQVYVGGNETPLRLVDLLQVLGHQGCSELLALSYEFNLDYPH